MAVGDLVIISTDCLQSKHTFKIGEHEEAEELVDVDNELKNPLVEEAEDDDLPRVLDLLT